MRRAAHMVQTADLQTSGVGASWLLSHLEIRCRHKQLLHYKRQCNSVKSRTKEERKRVIEVERVCAVREPRVSNCTTPDTRN